MSNQFRVALLLIAVFAVASLRAERFAPHARQPGAQPSQGTTAETVEPPLAELEPQQMPKPAAPASGSWTHIATVVPPFTPPPQRLIDSVDGLLGSRPDHDVVIGPFEHRFITPPEKFVGPLPPTWERISMESVHTGAVHAIAFAPDGKTLASAGEGGRICLADVSGKIRQMLPGDGGDVRSLLFSSDGRLLISGGVKRLLTVWDTAAQTSKTYRGFGGTILSLADANNGTVAVGVSDGTVQLWDFLKDRVLAVLNAHKRPVYAVAFSDNGRVLASGSSDGAVRLWNVARAKSRRALNVPGVVRMLHFGKNAKTLLTGSTSGQISTWDVASQQLTERRDLAGHLLWSIALNGKSGEVAAATLESAVYMIDGNRSPQPLEGAMETVRCVAFSPDGLHLAAGGQRKVAIWAFPEQRAR